MHIPRDTHCFGAGEVPTAPPYPSIRTTSTSPPPPPPSSPAPCSRLPTVSPIYKVESLEAMQELIAVQGLMWAHGLPHVEEEKSVHARSVFIDALQTKYTTLWELLRHAGSAQQPPLVCVPTNAALGHNPVPSTSWCTRKEEDDEDDEEAEAGEQEGSRLPRRQRVAWGSCLGEDGILRYQVLKGHLFVEVNETRMTTRSSSSSSAWLRSTHTDADVSHEDGACRDSAPHLPTAQHAYQYLISSGTLPSTAQVPAGNGTATTSTWVPSLLTLDSEIVAVVQVAPQRAHDARTTEAEETRVSPAVRKQLDDIRIKVRLGGQRVLRRAYTQQAVPKRSLRVLTGTVLAVFLCSGVHFMVVDRVLWVPRYERVRQTCLPTPPLPASSGSNSSSGGGGGAGTSVHRHRGVARFARSPPLPQKLPMPHHEREGTPSNSPLNWSFGERLLGVPSSTSSSSASNGVLNVGPAPTPAADVDAARSPVSPPPLVVDVEDAVSGSSDEEEEHGFLKVRLEEAHACASARRSGPYGLLRFLQEQCTRHATIEHALYELDVELLMFKQSGFIPWGFEVQIAQKLLALALGFLNVCLTEHARLRVPWDTRASPTTQTTITLTTGDSVILEPATRDDDDEDERLEIAANTYLTSNVYRVTLTHWRNVYTRDDALLRAASLYLQAHVTCFSLEIPPRKSIEGMQMAVRCLQRLDDLEQYPSVCAKLHCFESILNLLHFDVGGEDTTADDILPMLVYLVIYAAPRYLASTLRFLNHFSFPSMLLSNLGYALTTVSAATMFILEEAERIQAKKRTSGEVVASLLPQESTTTYDKAQEEHNGGPSSPTAR